MGGKRWCNNGYSFVSWEDAVKYTDAYFFTQDAQSGSGSSTSTTSSPGGQGTSDWVAIPASQCPADNGRTLKDCSRNMKVGELCEADSRLPNGNNVFNINNCGSYDVFRHVKVSATSTENPTTTTMQSTKE